MQHCNATLVQHRLPPQVARLLGFPPSFSFPATLGRRQRYKALGNSLNVRVVALLIRHLLTAD
jgi:tRNA (cytosine38-C5)-methyltransferase